MLYRVEGVEYRDQRVYYQENLNKKKFPGTVDGIGGTHVQIRYDHNSHSLIDHEWDNENLYWEDEKLYTFADDMLDMNEKMDYSKEDLIQIMARELWAEAISHEGREHNFTISELHEIWDNGSDGLDLKTRKLWIHLGERALIKMMDIL